MDFRDILNGNLLSCKPSQGVVAIINQQLFDYWTNIDWSIVDINNFVNESINFGKYLLMINMLDSFNLLAGILYKERSEKTDKSTLMFILKNNMDLCHIMINVLSRDGDKSHIEQFTKDHYNINLNPYYREEISSCIV